jgi:hypothetical protein
MAHRTPSAPQQISDTGEDRQTRTSNRTNDVKKQDALTAAAT